jgi:hypothetical protein
MSMDRGRWMVVRPRRMEVKFFQYFKDHKLLYPVNGPEEETWRKA